MTKATKGTIEKPAKKAAQKRGLNRSILAQSWGQFRRLLEYKCLMAGRKLHPGTCPLHQPDLLEMRLRGLSKP